MSEILEAYIKEVKEKPKEKNWLVKVLTNRSFFVIHGFLYLSVNGFLIMIWLLSLQFTGLVFFWPFHSLFGWGFGVGFHALSYVMYNDKSEYLTYIRQQSRYIMTFVYHAFFYISINLYLFLLNLIDLRFIWFTWTLGYWGIFFGYHALGFFTWNKIFNKQWKKLRPKYQDYSKKRLKSKIKYKIGNFWILLIHLTYFIVTYIIVNVYVFVGTGLGEIERLIILDIFISWGIYLVWHAFAYLLYYHVGILKSVVKGLLLHISIYSIVNGQLYYRNIEFEDVFSILIYFMLLWGIGVVIHTIIAIKWTSIMEKEQAKVLAKYEGREIKQIEKFWSGFSTEELPQEEILPKIKTILDKDEIRSLAKGILFWRWSFITHIIIYITGLIIIGINLTALGINLIILIHPIMGWLIGVAFHGAFYYVFQKPIKGFLNYTAFLHFIVYIVTCTYLVILNFLFTPGIPWSLIAILGWGIGIGIHIILMYITRESREIKKEEVPYVSKSILFWKWSFIIHLFIYITCLIIIGISLVTGGENLLLLIHPTMGWMIGLAAHWSIYFIIQKPIKGFFSYTALFHLTIYVVTSIYLVILNAVFSPEFPWSAIAISGWGIGIGLHLLLAYLTKNKES
ncbi:MAG: 2TM domain-containing protein [Promethearchaeota archaeon]